MRLLGEDRPVGRTSDVGPWDDSGWRSPRGPVPLRVRLRRAAGWALLHCGSLVIAVGCLAAYEHYRAEGDAAASLVSLVAAAGFGFAPVRHLFGAAFGIGLTGRRLVHGAGALALFALPLSGAVAGAPVLTHAALAPFALMGAVQALVHRDSPDPQQAVALRTFEASLPEVAQLAGRASLASPAGAQRAVAALSDILAKAQALGRSELRTDPGSRSALDRACTRFGADLGMDAVQLVLARMASRAGSAGAVATLRQELHQARASIDGGGARLRP